MYLVLSLDAFRGTSKSSELPLNIQDSIISFTALKKCMKTF